MKNKPDCQYDVISATRPERVVTAVVHTGVPLREAYQRMPDAARDSKEIMLIVKTGAYRVGDVYQSPSIPTRHAHS